MTKTTPKRKRSSSSSEPRTPTQRSSSSSDPLTPTHRSTVRELSRVDDVFQFIFSLLWFWGSNAFGQLGFGAKTTERTRPTPGRIAERVLDVATGGNHTVLIMMDGSVWSFGCNDDGALGRETTRPGEEDGDPTAPGEVTVPTEMMPIQVVCTESASFILTEDKVVYGCGTFRNATGVMGFSSNVEKQARFTKVYKPTYRDPPVSKLVAGGNHVIAILEDGSALSWGDGDEGQLGRIPLRTSRRRNNARDNMLTPARIQGFRKTKFTDAACGECSTFLKTSMGRFFGCGLNDSGQLSIHPTEVPTSEALDLEDRVASKMAVLKPTQLGALDAREIRYVACGKDHSLGVDRRGWVYSWGMPTHGVLGRESMIPMVSGGTSNPTPILVDGIDTPVEAISCGKRISGCIDEEGDFYTWGSSGNAMLGAADDEDLLVPRKMARTGSLRYRRFHKLAFGGQHVALLGQPKDTE